MYFFVAKAEMVLINVQSSECALTIRNGTIVIIGICTRYGMTDWMNSTGTDGKEINNYLLLGTSGMGVK